MRELLDDLIITLDNHHSLAPMQLLTLLKLFLACRRAGGRGEELPKDSSKPPKEEETLSSVLLSHYTNHKDVREALNKERRALGERMDIVTDGILKDIAEEKEKIDENIKKLEEEAESLQYKEEQVPGQEGRDDPEKEISPELKIVVDVLERCCFLLHTKDRDISLVLLDTLKLGCEVIESVENTQLPVLHKIWKPLMLRIKDTDTVVMLRAMLLLCYMVTTSGDFLRKRCVTDLLPLVRDFLISQSLLSREKTVRSGYLMTQQYSAQLSLLRDLLPQLIPGLQLSSDQMLHTLNAISHYLDTRQPAELVDAALNLFDGLSVSHPQMMWLIVAHHMKPLTLLPPDPTCHVIKVSMHYYSTMILVLINNYG